MDGATPGRHAGKVSPNRRSDNCALDGISREPDKAQVHFLWCWILVIALWQILRYSLIVCDIAMLLAIKGSWWVAAVVAAAGWYHIDWWMAAVVLVSNFAFEWFVWFYLPGRWLLRYEVNVQAFRFVDEMRKQMPSNNT